MDKYYREIITEDHAAQMLLENPGLDINNLNLDSVEKFNHAAALNHMDWCLQAVENLDCDPAEFHRQNQQQWNMPKEYAEFDIAQWLLDQCTNDQQLQRVGKELLLFHERDMLSLLCFLRYLVDTLRENNVVWGVGRGSSVASYVLYLIGVHKVDSLYYDLDIEEFLR